MALSFDRIQLAQINIFNYTCGAIYCISYKVFFIWQNNILLPLDILEFFAFLQIEEINSICFCYRMGHHRHNELWKGAVF